MSSFFTIYLAVVPPALAQRENIWYSPMTTKIESEWIVEGISSKQGDNIACPDDTSCFYHEEFSRLYRYASTIGYHSIQVDFSVSAENLGNNFCEVYYIIGRQSLDTVDWTLLAQYKPSFGSAGARVKTLNIPGANNNSIVGIEFYVNAETIRWCCWNQLSLSGIPITDNPTSTPTTNTTSVPTSGPTFLPTKHPTSNPSSRPTINPTRHPTTVVPTPNPITISPTIIPSIQPVTSKPSSSPIYIFHTTPNQMTYSTETTSVNELQVTNNIVSTQSDTLNDQNETMSENDKPPNLLLLVIGSSIAFVIFVIIIIGYILYRKTRNKSSNKINANELIKAQSISIGMQNIIKQPNDIITVGDDDDKEASGNEKHVSLNDQSTITKGFQDQNNHDDNAFHGESDVLYKDIDNVNDDVNEDDIDDMFVSNNQTTAGDGQTTKGFDNTDDQDGNPNTDKISSDDEPDANTNR